ncbi:MAG: hypothetical protein GKS07_08410 [Nitrosopumilus sp.]|nr:MAG: hypothetical protein GKS07_07335 [Nitrosopumilus sp.]QMU54896.1 MAG: hypothetical protein GKS07_08410 [Nitrosopumilus sp.]
MKITWDRCDCAGCKSTPTRYVSFPTDSAIGEKHYRIRVRVCEEHYESEKAAPNFRLEKTRRGIKKLHTLVEERK